MRSALVDTHEYLADAQVLKRTENKESYKKLIVKIAFKGLDLPIGNYFIRSTTLKRIMMMKKQSKINWFKLVMVLPLTAMLMGLVSMKTMPDPNFMEKKGRDNLSLIKTHLSADDSIKVTTKVKRVTSPDHYEYVSSLQEGRITAQIGGLQYEFGDISDTEEYRKILEMIQIFKQHANPVKNYHHENVEKDPDTRPAPVGGMSAWVQFLSQNLKMTTEARELGVNGTVFVEFIVDKEGKILSPVIKKSLGMGLDDEVLRIMSLPNVPQWTPGTKDGKAVNTLMILPVQFKTDQVAESSPFFPQVNSNAPTQEPQRADLFDVVEQMPVPEGGMEGWNEYISNNLKYPEIAREKGIEGTVYLVFIVNKEGQITDPQILRGIGGGADEEALRVVSGSPRWTPGRQSGRKVDVKMRVPIRFKLPEENTEGTARSQKINDSKQVLDISLEDPNHVLLRGRRVKMGDLMDKLSSEAKKLASKKVDLGQVTAMIKTNKQSTPGQVHQVEELLRKMDFHKITVDSTSFKTVSPVLIFK
jgi:TonB family protein